MSIANRFKQIREHFGLSQAQFAQKIKKSPGFISNVETGRSDVSLSTIQEVCSVFGINENWLLSDSGEMFAEGYQVSAADKDNTGMRIKMLRKNLNLTQEQFAETIGYSKMQIHYVESGKTIPSNEFLRNVASAFNISYQWLITGSGEIEVQEVEVDEDLIEWLKQNPKVVRELKIRSGLI